jgi:hypothetical protein
MLHSVWMTCVINEYIYTGFRPGKMTALIPRQGIRYLPQSIIIRVLLCTGYLDNQNINSAISRAKQATPSHLGRFLFSHQRGYSAPELLMVGYMNAHLRSTASIRKRQDSLIASPRPNPHDPHGRQSSDKGAP